MLDLPDKMVESSATLVSASDDGAAAAATAAGDDDDAVPWMARAAALTKLDQSRSSLSLRSLPSSDWDVLPSTAAGRARVKITESLSLGSSSGLISRSSSSLRRQKNHDQQQKSNQIER